MNTNNNQYINQEILKDLQSRYKKSTLTKKELSNELSMSLSSINQYISKGIGLPNYLKLGSGVNSRVVFPVVNIVEYLSNTIKVS